MKTGKYVFACGRSAGSRSNCGATLAPPQTCSVTWIGNASNRSWSTAGNWSPRQSIAGKRHPSLPLPNFHHPPDCRWASPSTHSCQF
jgi:hypothetical protein